MLPITIYLIFSMLAVLWLDVTRFTIPNWLNASLILLYPVAVWLSPHIVDWKMALVGMLIVFAVGYAVFSMRWMGGGDIKLITACSLWVGWEKLLDFIFLFALLGGAFSIIIWVTRKVLLRAPAIYPKLPRILKEGEPIAYGVAIAIAFLIMMWTGKIELIR